MEKFKILLLIPLVKLGGFHWKNKLSVAVKGFLIIGIIGIHIYIYIVFLLEVDPCLIHILIAQKFFMLKQLQLKSLSGWNS